MNGHRLVVLELFLVVIATLSAACSSSSPNPPPTSIPATPAPPTSIPTIALTFDPTPTPTHIPTPPVPAATPMPVASSAPTATVPAALLAPVIVIEATAIIGSCEFRLEVADDATEWGRGLMERESMPIDQGMLFVFNFQQELNFWMKNTLIPLDIVYRNDELQVVDVQTIIPEHEIAPDPLPFYTSASPAKFALEINAGVAAECDITPGVTMTLTYLN